VFELEFDFDFDFEFEFEFEFMLEFELDIPSWLVGISTDAVDKLTGRTSQIQSQKENRVGLFR
jgi:hypothetical protein